MNIRIDNLSSEAWDEVYYILNSKSKFIKKPNRKAYGLADTKKNKMTYLLCFALALLIVVLIRCLKHINIVTDIVIGVFILVIIINRLLNNYIIYKYTKRDINRRINTKNKMTSLKINNDGVILVQSRKHIVTLSWNEISHILINKETIVFLSKKRDRVSIVVPIKIKKRLLDKLKKEEKLNLVVDNTELYEQEEDKYIKYRSILEKVVNFMKKNIIIVIGIIVVVLIWLVPYMFTFYRHATLKDLSYGGAFSPIKSYAWGKISMGEGYVGEYDSNVYDIVTDEYGCSLSVLYYEEKEKYTLKELQNKETTPRIINEHKWYVNKDNTKLFTENKKYIYEVKLDNKKECAKLNKKIIESLKFKK